MGHAPNIPRSILRRTDINIFETEYFVKHVFKHLMLATIAVGLCSPAMAYTLSSKAKKLSSAQVKKIYAGKTANWKRTKGYFAPDGTFLIWHRKNKHYVVGKWKVSRNRMCKSGTWYDPSSGETSPMKKDCTKWVIDKKKYWSLWDGDENGKDGWYGKEMKKMKKGDSVSRKVKALQAKFAKLK